MHHNLVDIDLFIPRILLDIRYATSNNFLGFPAYSQAACYLHKDAASALYDVQLELAKSGLALKVFDGYRPLHVQQVMWDAIQDERFVANPAKNKGRHTRGTAVDVTLVDSRGRELEMPSEFDDFTEKAHSEYPHCSQAALQNRALLKEVMAKHRFLQVATEWWHFDLEGWQDDVKYPALDLHFNDI